MNKAMVRKKGQKAGTHPISSLLLNLVIPARREDGRDGNRGDALYAMNAGPRLPVRPSRSGRGV